VCVYMDTERERKEDIACILICIVDVYPPLSIPKNVRSDVIRRGHDWYAQ